MRSYLLVFVSLILIVCGSSSLLAAEIKRLSNHQVSGTDAKLGVTFHAERDLSSRIIAADEVYLIEIDLTHSRRLSARVDYTSQSLTIGYSHIASGVPVRISRKDIATFTELETALPQIPGRMGDALASLVSYIAEAPVNALVDIRRKPQTRGTRSWQSLCGAVGTTQIATYDKLFGKTVRRKQRVSQCYEQIAECFGRCGKDCNMTQPSRMQRITQDCLNHDVCTEDLGLTNPACTDEFYSAADDFFYAPDCGEMGGQSPWIGSDLFRWKLNTSDTAKFTGRVVTPNCGAYRVIGRRPGRGSFTLQASSASPLPGCCTNILYTGAMDTCTTAAATWANACGASGSATLSREGFPLSSMKFSGLHD